MPKVSIIVPVYKAEAYLNRCVESLVSQTLNDIEIILVDDGSPDKSGEVCDEWKSKDERIRVIHKANAGAGYARNSGLEKAEGEYIGFIDADDYADTDMFEKLYDAALKYHAQFAMTGYKAVGGTVFHTDSVQKFSYFSDYIVFDGQEKVNQLMLDTAGALPESSDDSKYGCGIWKCLFERRVIQDNGLKFLSEREMVSEDALFLLDFLSCTDTAVGVPGEYYNYCWNGDSISKGYSQERFNKSVIMFSEVRKRLGRRMDSNVYDIYVDRIFQAYARCCCVAVIQSRSDKNEQKKNLKAICSSEELKKVLKNYPISKLPIKQSLFAYAMKHSQFFLLRVMVSLRREL